MRGLAWAQRITAHDPPGETPGAPSDDTRTRYLTTQNPWLSICRGTLNLLRVFRAPKQFAYLHRIFYHLDHTSPPLSVHLHRGDVTFGVT